jgi:aldose 1-epimerase
VGAAIEERRFRGEPAVTLTAGDTSVTFLPELGMTGVSLRYRGAEHFALPGWLATLRAGRTLGLPLLAPWANRLAKRHYRAAGITVDLRGLPLQTDSHGLPMHGLLVGRPGWQIDQLTARGGAARLVASIPVDAEAFPFPHRIELAVTAREAQLQVDTTVIPTGRRRVPVAFGWHPYLRLPTTARSRWHLRLPPRRHCALDFVGIPTGASTSESAEAAPVGRRTFDDLYALGRYRRLALETDDAAIELHCGANYPFAQVWVPPGRPYAALEPMAAATNALEDGTAPLIPPGEAFTARFALNLSAGRKGARR